MSKVAAVQMCPGEKLADNLTQAAHLIERAVAAGAELIVLPENFAYLGAEAFQDALRQEQGSAGPVRRFLAEQAKQHAIWLVGGTVPVADYNEQDFPGIRDKAYAACLVFNPAGRQAARYNKIHLFDVDVEDTVGRYRESERYLPGDTPVVIDTDVGRVGLSVCYDLRFPELYRCLVDQGAEILVVPSAFTAATGEAHWQLLLRARAVENFCYVIGADQGDRQARKPTWGGSCIVDPWGVVLAEQAEGEGVVIADLDLPKLHKIRSRLPALEHRRIGAVQER